MINPKEKADELIAKFTPHTIYWDCYNDEPIEEPHALRCAIICCKEIMLIALWKSAQEFEFWTNVLYELEHYEEQ